MQKRLKTALENFRTLLADVDAYRTFLGVGSAAAALERTYVARAADDGSEPRPRGIVDFDGASALKTSISEWHFDQGSELILDLEWEGGHSAWSTFAAHVEDVVDGIMQKAGDGYLNLTAFRSDILWQRNRPEFADGVEYWLHESIWSFEG